MQDIENLKKKLEAQLETGHQEDVIKEIRGIQNEGVTTDIEIVKIGVFALCERNLSGDLKIAEDMCLNALRTCSPNDKSDVFILLGRGQKHKFINSVCVEDARKCKEYYDIARILSRDPYDIVTLINLLTFLYVLGEDFSTFKIKEHIAALKVRVSSPHNDHFWRISTLLVLHCIEGEFSKMISSMEEIIQHKPSERELLSTLRNVIVLVKWEGNMMAADRLVFNRSYQDILENFLRPDIHELSIFAVTLFGNLCRITPTMEDNHMNITFEGTNDLKILTRARFHFVDNKIEIITCDSKETILFANFEKARNVFRWIRKHAGQTAEMRHLSDSVVLPPIDFSGVGSGCSFLMTWETFQNFRVRIVPCRNKSETGKLVSTINAINEREIRHPVLFRHQEVIQHDLFVSFVVDYYNVISLRDLILSEEPIVDRDIVEWVHELFDGLAYLHDLGIIHGFICGRTVYLSSFKIKIEICDFFTTANLVSGEKVDGLMEMAPEVLKYGLCGVCAESDIWGLGTVTCELITRQPFDYDNIKTESGIVPILPVWDFILKCCGEEPSMRTSLKDLKFHDFLLT